MSLTAVYPGTFDPVTKGHVDIIERASIFADRLIVGVAENEPKEPIFPLEERVAMMIQEVAPLRAKGHQIEVMPFTNLLVEFAGSVGASVVIRGLRSFSDFDQEFQMALINSRLNPEIQTICMMAGEHLQLVSSKFVKEICRYGGKKIEEYVSPLVAERLRKRFNV